MKGILHAVAGVVGFLLVAAFVTSTTIALVLQSQSAIATVKAINLAGMFALLPALVGAGATGVSLLGKRTDGLALTKQKRGPIAFMTSLFVLLPTASLLWWRASAGTIDTLFYTAQAIELLGSTVCLVMIGLNIRDGLALRGRISRRGVSSPGIEERDGGPLVVTGLTALNSSAGTSLDTRRVVALCRCGASKNKPFCDGSHNQIAFDSSPSDGRTEDTIRTYEGEKVTIHYNRLLCSHAAECGKRQKAAFDSSRKPWIIPDNATPDALHDVVQACPSGALRYSTPDPQGTQTTPQHLQTDTQGITVEQDGPYRITGIPLKDARLAAGASPHKFVLCRCGASKNKPFCDGSHHDIGWRSES